MLITVYRIENHLGNGPYHHVSEELDTNPQYNCMCMEHNNLSKYPNGWADKITEYCIQDYHYVFAFGSLDQLYQWFGPYLNFLLTEFGFSVMMYEVESDTIKYGKSGKQLVFNRKNVKGVPVC